MSVISVVFTAIYSTFFFFKQKTAYEMRISDWSSDVCSSDLSMAMRGPKIDTIVFDLDGTLVDTAPDLIAALNHSLEVLGRPTVEPMLVRPLADRKSTRLNSSH